MMLEITASQITQKTTILNISCLKKTNIPDIDVLTITLLCCPPSGPWHWYSYHYFMFLLSKHVAMIDTNETTCLSTICHHTKQKPAILYV